MRMHLLSGGRLRMRRSVYYPDASRDETMELPVSCALLKHGQGLALFDTGCHPSVATDAEARWGSLARLITPIFAAQEAVVSQLPAAGVEAGDIDVVICSHLHPDHCGCNLFFPNATILAHVDEIAAARAEGAPSQGYVAVEFDHSNPLMPVRDGHDLFGDGRITLLHVPGHTPGMMAAHVVLDRDGAFMLASDAVAVRAHLDRRYAPRNTRNVEQAIASIEKIAWTQQNGGTILFGHDSEQWAGLRTGPQYYA